MIHAECSCSKIIMYVENVQQQAISVYRCILGEIKSEQVLAP